MPKKTKCILFSPNGLSPPLPKNLIINNSVIERIGLRFSTKHFKLVGVCLDDRLNWGEHAKKVRAKLAKTTYALARLKNMVPEAIKLQIYNSMFKCHTDYCLPIWGDCPGSDKRSISTIQKKAVRNIASARFNAHTDNLFKRFKIIKFSDQINFARGIFMFNISLGTHPANITDLFVKSNNFDRNLDYVLKNSLYTYISRQVPASLIISWNNLQHAFKGWLKEKPDSLVNKKINSSPTRVFNGNNINLNNYRLKGFKDAFTQATVYNYKQQGKCNNKMCSECSSIRPPT